MDFQQYKAKKNRSIRRTWNEFVDALNGEGVHVGAEIKFTYIPGQGWSIIAERGGSPWAHPWKCGLPDAENKVVMRKGTVNGQVPWVTSKTRLGEVDKETGEVAGVTIPTKDSGDLWLAVGCSIEVTEGEFATIGEKATFDQLKMGTIDKLPEGFGRGGIIPDAQGWAWYPLVHYLFFDGAIEAIFQVVYHNLSHQVVAGGEERNEERHFFLGGG